VKINEWLADAVALFPNDFIELMNTATLPVNVGNCYVTIILSRGRSTTSFASSPSSRRPDTYT
jgi:hypothetical protein